MDKTGNLNLKINNSNKIIIKLLNLRQIAGDIKLRKIILLKIINKILKLHLHKEITGDIKLIKRSKLKTKIKPHNHNLVI